MTDGQTINYKLYSPKTQFWEALKYYDRFHTSTFLSLVLSGQQHARLPTVILCIELNRRKRHGILIKHEYIFYTRYRGFREKMIPQHLMKRQDYLC